MLSSKDPWNNSRTIKDILSTCNRRIDCQKPWLHCICQITLLLDWVSWIVDQCETKNTVNFDFHKGFVKYSWAIYVLAKDLKSVGRLKVQFVFPIPAGN